jgi:hypothetical protein
MQDHERAQRRRQARLPLKDRLLWLDDALRLARHIQTGVGDRTNQESERLVEPHADAPPMD